MNQYLDRTLQNRLLREIADIYPESASLKNGVDGVSERDLLVNIQYLHEHGLIVANIQRLMTGPPSVLSAKATARGLDFLADDGGLSAILGTITVKLHDDTIRALLIDKVNASDADTSTKGRLIEAIKSLPAEGLKRLAHKAMDSGIEHLPAAVQPLQEWLGLL